MGTTFDDHGGLFVKGQEFKDRTLSRSEITVVACWLSVGAEGDCSGLAVIKVSVMVSAGYNMVNGISFTQK